MDAHRLEISDLAAWIELRFDPARGPGGQHVNKVSTRATLLLDFQHCQLFSPVERGRIDERLASRLARDGRLRIVAQRGRSQAQNSAVAGERLLELLDRALHVPTPRRPSRPSAGAQRRRVQTKLRRGKIKQGRRRPTASEE